MDAAGDSGAKCMWRPNPSKRTHMDIFRERVNKKFDLNLITYQDLHQWSVQSYGDFWQEVWHYTDIVHSKIYEEVVDKTKAINEIPGWFHGSRMNFAENLLRHRDDRVAIYATGEGREEVKTRTFAQLYEDVALFAAALKKMGVVKGDRVVGYIPNGIEAIEAMLAAASIGAIWSSTSPEFGITGVLDRFCQIQPKVIFSVNAVIYNNKHYNHLNKLEHVVKGLPELQKVVVIPYVVTDGENTDISHIRNSCFLDDFLATGRTAENEVPDLVFEQLPFNHPLFIMYSSGTTGAPKCMVHSAGGTLIKHLEEHVLQGNTNRDDVMLYYTTTGWMMWNWYVSVLAVGAAVVCYDGSPLVPHANILWDLVDKLGITILGTGAKWLAVLEEKGVKPGKTNSLKSLHTILSTGSPLKPHTYDYVYRDVKEDLLLGSITGGTDIIACFAGQNWTLPVYRGEIQSCNLGCDMQSWTEEGKPVIGESGELVCATPFPSMPTHFWNDPDGLKYKKAYFMKFSGMWAHGDFCLFNPETGGIWMLGRSDGTLNPSGVRFGSAEIYHVVEAFKEVQDSLCVSQQNKDRSEERVILFLKMAPGTEFTEEIVKQVKACIRGQLSARHVPAIILETKDIPYTHSGKKVEVAVKKVLAGEDVTQRGAYSNPESLDLYYGIPALQGDF